MCAAEPTPIESLLPQLTPKINRSRTSVEIPAEARLAADVRFLDSIVLSHWGTSRALYSLRLTDLESAVWFQNAARLRHDIGDITITPGGLGHWLREPAPLPLSLWAGQVLGSTSGSFLLAGIEDPDAGVQEMTFRVVMQVPLGPWREEPEEPVKAAEPNVRRILVTLIDSLGLKYEEVAAITHVGRTSLFYWRGHAVKPRASSLRPLLRLYALGRALIGHFGNSEDAAAWLRAGRPSAVERLAGGDFESVENAVADLVFGESTVGQDTYAAVSAEPELDVDLSEGSAGPGAARRVSRRSATPAVP